jgi:menaquinone-dependent protoporphyrinogen IX oxidase
MRRLIMKVVILYGTRLGATRSSAVQIEKGILAENTHSTQLQDVNKAHSLEKIVREADALVLGSSVFAGQWVGRAKKVLKLASEEQKPVAVYVSTGRKAAPGPDDSREADVHAYIDPVCDRLHLMPVSVNVFGTKIELFGKEVFNSWNADLPFYWGRKLSKLLAK